MKQLALAILLTLVACSGQESKPDKPRLPSAYQPVEVGTLNGQVFAVSETGNFHPARSARGHLISCEPTTAILPGVGSVTANACDYFLRAKRQLRPESRYAEALSAFLSAFMWVRLHRVRDVPFQVDAQGFFSVSTVTGSYIVYVDGLAGGHRCIWLLSGVQVGKTPVSIKLSPRAIVEPGGDEDLTRPSLRNRI